MKIAILFGGSSFEHEISIVSAITMKKVLKNSEIIYIFVNQNREFYFINSNEINSKLFSSGEYKKSKKLTLENGGFFTTSLFSKRKIDFDVALNLIHGRDGEDGKVASLMEFYNIPYISPRIEASNLSYNKLYTKLYAQSIGVDVIDYQLIKKGQDVDLKFDYPVIVKPVRLGSSIGVSIVKESSELDYALDVAFEFDTDVIIEPFIDGIKEYNLAGTFTDDWELSIIEEPHKEEFLDFDKKYMDFSRDSQVLKANIDDGLEIDIQKNFKNIYSDLFKGSLIRCDFFVIDDKVFLNEINPIPGSMANYLFDDFEGIISRLANNLPSESTINIDYRYIDSIQSAKGKA